MATIQKFEDLEVWQMDRKQSNEIWKITVKEPFFDDKGLFWQLNRSTGSVMDNISEGFGRGGNKEFILFLGYARGSNDEVRSQLYRALDRKHISANQFDKLFEKNRILTIKISNFRKYLKNSINR